MPPMDLSAAFERPKAEILLKVAYDLMQRAGLDSEAHICDEWVRLRRGTMMSPKERKEKCRAFFDTVKFLFRLKVKSTLLHQPENQEYDASTEHQGTEDIEQPPIAARAIQLDSESELASGAPVLPFTPDNPDDSYMHATGPYPSSEALPASRQPTADDSNDDPPRETEMLETWKRHIVAQHLIEVQRLAREQQAPSTPPVDGLPLSAQPPYASSDALPASRQSTADDSDARRIAHQPPADDPGPVYALACNDPLRETGTRSNWGHHPMVQHNPQVQRTACGHQVPSIPPANRLQTVQAPPLSAVEHHNQAQHAMREQQAPSSPPVPRRVHPFSARPFSPTRPWTMSSWGSLASPRLGHIQTTTESQQTQSQPSLVARASRGRPRPPRGARVRTWLDRKVLARLRPDGHKHKRVRREEDMEFVYGPDAGANVQHAFGAGTDIAAGTYFWDPARNGPPRRSTSITPSEASRLLRAPIMTPERLPEYRAVTDGFASGEGHSPWMLSSRHRPGEWGRY